MPSGKSKEDTWKASDLDKELRSTKDDKGKRSTAKKSDERELRHRDDKSSTRDSDRRRREDVADVKDRERRHREEKDAKDKDREKRHREEKEGGDRDRERRHREEKDEGDRERRHRNDAGEGKDKDRERKHRTDTDAKDRERRHRDDAEKEKLRPSKHRSEEAAASSDKPRRRHEADTGDGPERKQRSKDEAEQKDKDSERRDKDKERKHRNKDETSDQTRTSKREDDKPREHRRDKDGEKREKNGDGGEERHRRKETDGELERKPRRHHDKDNEAAGAHSDKKERSRKDEERSKTQSSSKKKNDDYGGYEDDFEAYEEDFDPASDSSDDLKVRPAKQKTNKQAAPDNGHHKKEAINNKEMDEILTAMSAENERLLSGTGSRGSSNRQLSSPDSSRAVSPRTLRNNNTAASTAPRVATGSVFDFMSAKRRNLTSKAVGRLQGRAKDLAGIIECESVSHSWFEHQPSNEYDSFIKNFGQSNATQAYVQTCDDNIDRDVQTEDITLRDKWTQHPSGVDVAPFGGDITDENKENLDKPLDSISLSKFLEKAIRVMAILLEENTMDSLHTKVGHKQSNIVISKAFVELCPVSILEGRHCTFSQFSPVHSQLLLAAYSLPAESSSALGSDGVICVWNVYEPQLPQKVLISRLQPQCCCFSPNKPTLVFAGMTDGSVVVWDLRESSNCHRSYQDKNGNEFLLRQPTYNTAGVLQSNNHQSPIVAITPVIASAAGSRSSGDGEAANTDCLAFQVASLEVDSVLSLWVVAELGQPDVAGSLSDLGLRPGGRIKLIKSSTIQLENPLRDRVVQSKFRSFDMQLLPDDNNHFFVTTDTGCVVHGLRHGGRAVPKCYKTEAALAVEVTSIDFSPFCEPVFLVGCADGSLRLYHVDSDAPIMTWPQATDDARAVTLVRWCRSRPSVFFVLDAESFLYIWDLNMEESSALKRERISKHANVCSLCLSNDFSATGQGLPGRSPQMMVFLENGTAEAHVIKPEFCALMPDELDKFAFKMQSVM